MGLKLIDVNDMGPFESGSLKIFINNQRAN